MDQLLQFQLFPLQPGCFSLNCDTEPRSNDIILQAGSSTGQGLSLYLYSRGTQHNGGLIETVASGQCKLHIRRKAELESLIVDSTNISSGKILLKFQHCISNLGQFSLHVGI